MPIAHIQKMWKFYATVLLFTLLSSTTDVYSKKGGGIGSSPSRGTSILSKIKNTFTNRGHQATGLRKPASMPRPPTNLQNRGGGGTSWKAPAVGLGAGALGGYGAHKWARNAGHSRYSGLSSNKKAAIAGTLGALAGGYVGYKMGKAVGRYNTFYGGRNYWYGSRYYNPTGGRKTCIFEVDGSTSNWNLKYDDDNTAVREVIFECMPHEQCCELSCCRVPSTYVRSGSHRGWHWWHTLLFLAILVILQEIILGNFWDLLAMPAWLLMASATLFVASSFSNTIRDYFIIIFDQNALLVLVLGIILSVCIFGGTKAMESRRENSAPICMTTYEDESRKPFNQPDNYSNYPPSYPAAYPTQPTVYPSCPPGFSPAYAQQPPPYTAVH